MHPGRDRIAQKNQLRAHREELQRVQIGLVGLAAVLLVVTLANLVIQAAHPDGSDMIAASQQTVAGAAVTNASGSAPTGTNEPLADLGVTPTTATDSSAPSVPDLEPDPRLKTRMDRDPDQSAPTH